MRKWKRVLLVICCLLLAGFLIPESFRMPVNGADRNSYAQNSFWFYPWGSSITHKGVDIFAKKGKTVTAATPGIVVYTGELSKGGKVVLILGPKWRFHYYAHLDVIETSTGSYVNHQSKIGTVGTTGNAQGKPAHLHYSIKTWIPYFWKADKSRQGWKKMFYLNPVEYLNAAVG